MDDKLFSNLKELQKDMLKILGDVTSITSKFSIGDETVAWKPKYDMFETDLYLIILVDIAGIRREAISIKYSENSIELSGERIINIQCEDACFYNLEIEAGKFFREIMFPDIEINLDNPIIKYENGFLKIAFHKIINK